MKLPESNIYIKQVAMKTNFIEGFPKKACSIATLHMLFIKQNLITLGNLINWAIKSSLHQSLYFFKSRLHPEIRSHFIKQRLVLVKEFC